MLSNKFIGSTFLPLFFILGIIPLFAQEKHIVPLEKSAEPLHLWVQFGEHPDREAVVSWSTTVLGNTQRVYIDTVKRNAEVETYTRQIKQIHSGPYTIEKEEKAMQAWYHHAYLDKLEPATPYYITVETDGSKSGEYYFITAPADDTEVALLLGGDSRLGDDRIEKTNARRGMNARMRKLLEENPDIVGLAHSADYTNTGRWSELFYWLNDHFEETTTEDGRLLPIFPARGNHDTRIGFEEMFWWPNRKNDFYYTVNINNTTALVILNTEISLIGDQRVWLEEQLKNLRPEKKWLTTMYHRPAFPSVRAYEDGEARRRTWVPLFEKYRIDLVTSGHDHSLKRTLPILDTKPNAEGIVYIGDGGLGVRPRDVDATRWYLKSPGIAQSIYNVHFVRYTPDAIHIKAVGMNGELLDSFSIPADRTVRTLLYSELIKGKKQLLPISN